MDKYEEIRESASLVRNAMEQFSLKFKDFVGTSLVEQDDNEHRLLYALVDLKSALDDEVAELVDYVEQRYRQFREDAFEYLIQLHDRLDENDPRKNDLWFQCDPSQVIEYLDENDIDDSYVDENLRKIAQSRLFYSALESKSDEAFFEEETRNNYAIQCLKNPDIDD